MQHVAAYQWWPTPRIQTFLSLRRRTRVIMIGIQQQPPWLPSRAQNRIPAGTLATVLRVTVC